MSWSHRSLFALYVLGLVVFAASCLAGIWYAVTREGSAPSLVLSYPPHIERLLEEGRRKEALEQLQRAARIETDNPTLYRNLTLLAYDLLDDDALRFAGRAWTRLDANDPMPRSILCASLLNGRRLRATSDDELALVNEALEHGERLVALDPDSAEGQRCVGLALVLRGSHSGAPIDFMKGAAHLARAIELDSEFVELDPWLRYARSKSRL